jgi:peptide/nickel transport system substrate-binding protein
LILLALALAACGPAAPVRSPAADGGGSASTAPKVITIGLNEDPPGMWEVATQVGGAGGRQLLPAVSQFLAVIGADGAPHPRLLAELPSVERGTWKLLPDGTMETVWTLRPDVLWHDGTPFTAQDVVFSWQVNRDPEIPNANRETATLIAELQADGPTSLVARWSTVYPYADRLSDRELVPVPRHLLEASYREAKEAFLLQPYWSTAYVGLGPFRITRWDRGSTMELAAFDRYFLGQPKIDTVRVQFVPDANTMMASLHAGAVQSVLPPGGPTPEPGLLLKQAWEASGYGTVLVYPLRWSFLEAQKRNNPQPPDLADARVRRALLHALDRAELVRAVFGEYGTVADSWVQPDEARARVVGDGLTRYPYDASRALAQFGEAGWSRGADGTLEKGGQRFTVNVRGDERVAAIVIDAWRAAGVAGEYEQFPPQLARDRAARASFSGFDINTGPTSILNVGPKFATSDIPGPENQWTGLNRGGYGNADWDRLIQAIGVTLEEPRRLEMERQMLRIFSADLPALPIYFGLELVPVGGGLSGVQPIRASPHIGTILHTWNVHEWDVQPRR